VSPRLAALREWAARLLGTLTGRRRDADLEEELRAHAELAAEDGARRGGQVAYSDRARSRSIDQALELMRDQRGLPRVESLLADAVFGWRQVRAHPAVSLAAVLSLGLAMGASIGAFRIVDALLLRPLAVKEPGRLFRLEQTSVDPQGRVEVRDDFDYPTFRDYVRVLAGRADAIVVGQTHPQAVVFGPGPDSERVLLQYLSGNAFGVLGLQPVVGRLLTPADDDAPGAHAVAVLSHDYWTRRFERSPEVVGSAMRLGDQVYEVIGVAPASFIGTEPGLVPSVWVPATMHTRALERRGWSWFQIWVRPGSGAGPQAIQQALQAAIDGELRDHASQPRVELQPAGRGASRLQKRLGAPLWILSALVGLVLLMACATVGNLLIGLTLAREREVAVRVSLGAGRARLMQLVLVEGAILALGASMLATLVAWQVPAALVGMIQPIPIPVQLVLGLDWRVAAFAAALTIAVAALVGAGPALRAASMAPQAALKRGSTHGARRMAGGLVVAQMAFCAFVVFAAVLFVATFDRLSSQPLGFSPDDVLVVAAESRQGEDRPARWRRVEEVVRELPGVESTGLAGWPLVADNGWRAHVRVDGAGDGRAEYFLPVGPRVFDVLRIARLDGRDFFPGDRAPGLDADGRRPVAGVGVVNEAFARRYFGGRSPVGRQIQMRQAGEIDATLQIVGLVRDTPYRRMRDPIHPIVFVPFGRVGEGVLMVRGESDTAGLAPAITRVLQREWPGARVRDLRPASDYIRTQMVVERLLARLCSAFALLALLLAAIGLYAVVNDAVVRRRREIGVRLALGARAADVVRAVTAGALVRVVIGLLLGLGAGIGFGRVVGAILFRVAPTDAGPLAVPLVVLVALFALASLSPSIRAVRTDPCETLRCE
jgi:predicted permease